MGKQAFDRKLEELKSLRTAAELRKPLQDRNNYVVSKAAEIVASLKLEALIPDLVKAFDRFLQDSVKSDPQCWAKNAIAQALYDLGHRDAEVFLKGSTHIQKEPVWGGTKDSAGKLRSICSLALIECHLDVLRILVRLTDLLADEEPEVRVNAARALGMLGTAEGTLPLRLKARIGDRESEVTGQCFASLTAIDPAAALEFIRPFLESRDESVQAEAGSVLAQSKDPKALDAVIAFLKAPVQPEVRRSILISLGASPLRGAAEYLLTVVEEEEWAIAIDAITGLAASRFRSELREQAKAAAEANGSAKLTAAFEREFR